MTEKRRVNWEEAVVPGLTMVFALAFFYQTWDGPPEAMYWPLGAAGILGGLWLLVIIRFLTSRREPGEKLRFKLEAVKSRLRRSALMLLAPLAYLALMPWLGFTIGNFLFLLVMFRSLGGRSWTRNTIISLLITTFLHIALIIVMKLSLPRLSLGSLTI